MQPNKDQRKHKEVSYQRQVKVIQNNCKKETRFRAHHWRRVRRGGRTRVFALNFYQVLVGNLTVFIFKNLMLTVV